ncbi:hypothetical protein C2S51_007431 [Perilla frutescens var. frutescens]|nr:hypothetical protein C2S51_007431 [Perilla frutescens var. frutescens]
MVTTRSTETRLDQLEKVVEELSAAFNNFQMDYQTFRTSTDAKSDALLKKFAIPTGSTENNESGRGHVMSPEEEYSTPVQVI